MRIVRYKTFFGETFDDIKKRLKGIETDDEFDIVLLNEHSACLLEVKSKGKNLKISKFLKKAKAFRLNFPKYKDHKIYLGLAALVFDAKTEEKCIKKGIAVIKQVGDNVVINYEHLKAY